MNTALPEIPELALILAKPILKFWRPRVPRSKGASPDQYLVLECEPGSAQVHSQRLPKTRKEVDLDLRVRTGIGKDKTSAET